MIDYDTGNKEELDEEMGRCINEKGGVWIKREGYLYYMDTEWIKRVLKLRNPPIPLQKSPPSP